MTMKVFTTTFGVGGGLLSASGTSGHELVLGIVNVACTGTTAPGAPGKGAGSAVTVCVPNKGTRTVSDVPGTWQSTSQFTVT
jgi:hypothetical protein